MVGQEPSESPIPASDGSQIGLVVCAEDCEVGGGCLQLQLDGKIGLAPHASRLRCTFVLRSDGAGPGAPNWMDPGITSWGRLAAHAPLRSCRCEADALAMRDGRLCLSGEWAFRPGGRAESSPTLASTPGYCFLH